MQSGSEDESRSFRGELVAVVCGNLQAVYLLMLFCVVLLTLSVLSLAFIDREAPSFVILQFNFAMLLSFMVVLGIIFYRCTR